jgi:hypothetical protein
VARAPKGESLAGLRVEIVREYMVEHAANDAAMSDLVNAEIKKILRDELGATSWSRSISCIQTIRRHRQPGCKREFGLAFVSRGFRARCVVAS